MVSALNRNYPEIQGELETELEDEDELEDEVGSEFEAEDEDEDFLGAIGGIGKALSGLLGDGEHEAEFEFEAEAETEDEAAEEYEDEAFVNPVRRIYPDAELMAHLSAKAARSANDSEAEAFLGALVPIAAKLVPRAATVLVRHTPALIRGTSALGRRLRRDPAISRFVMAIPVILQRTAQSLADQAASGRPVTPDSVISTLTRIAARLLRTPSERDRAVRAVTTFDRRYHRRGGRPSAAPAPSRRRRRATPSRAARRRSPRR